MTTGTSNLQSVISKFASVELSVAGFATRSSPAALVVFEVNTQFLDHFESKEIS